MTLTTSRYQDFRATAAAAGIAPETVSILSDGYRDAEQHGWSGQALDWCGDPQQLIERGLEAPEKIAAVCAYFFASDGGNHVEGLRYLDNATRELAERVLAAGWGGLDESDEVATCFLVKINFPGFSRKYLEGPRSPQDVKKLGYGFTNEQSEAWSFPTRKQAQAKARVIDRHMGWGFGYSNAIPAR